MNAQSSIRMPRKPHPIPLADLIQLFEAGMQESDPFFERKNNERNR